MYEKDGEDRMLEAIAFQDSLPIFNCPRCGAQCEQEVVERPTYLGEPIHVMTNIDYTETMVWHCPNCDRRWAVGEIPF